MDSKELYTKAYNLHYSKGDFSKAIELYREIIKDFPESEEAGYSKNQIENIKNMSDSERERLKNKKEKQEEGGNNEQKGHLSIPDIGGLWVAVFGIFLLLITFFISLSLGTPEKLGDIEGYYNTIKAVYALQFIGLVITFSGIILMVYSFYLSWKEAMEKLFEKLK